MRDNLYNIALQTRYDELIHFSKDIWAESAAGGFTKKKIDVNSKPLLNTVDSPSTIKKSQKGTLGRKDSALNQVDKKKLFKLHSMQPNELD